MTKTIYLLIMASMQLGALLAFIMYLNKSLSRWQWEREPQQDEIFKQHHIDLSVKQYQFIRGGIIIVLILFSVYRMLLIGQVNVLAFCLIGLLYFITSLETSSFNSKISMIHAILNKLDHHQQKKKRNELFLLMTYLKTMAMMEHDDSFIDILSVLHQHASILKTEIGTLLRQCQLENNDRKRKLIQQFIQSIGGVEVESFGKVLTKLIDNPLKHVEQEITLHQQRIFEIRQTEREHKDEQKNECFFGLATVLFMLIMLNFIVIAIMSNEVFAVL